MTSPEPEAEPDQAETFTPAEELALVVATAMTQLTQERDQARSMAARLEEDLALAIGGLETAVTDWPETSWAADSIVQGKLEGLLSQLRDPDAGA